jgi:predicted membrane-bound mannosyltransferase
MEKINYLLVLNLFLATVLRFYKLGSLPPGLHPDEAANGLDIISIFEKGKLAVVYGTNGPREALFFYFQAIFVYIGKVTHWTALNFTPLSLRIAPAIIGVLTVCVSFR